MDHALNELTEGLRAAGLDPDAVALPKRGKAGQVASSR
jgi:hypothetical protein